MTDLTEEQLSIYLAECNIPEHMHGAVTRYMLCGIEPGSFLRAVICNDLMGAAMRADDVNQDRLRDYVNFFYNCAPSSCWGSSENYYAWLAMGNDRRMRIMCAFYGLNAPPGGPTTQE